MNLVYAMGIGFLLDCIFGDPHSMPHPVRLIGRLIAALEKKLRPEKKEGGERKTVRELFAGSVLVLLVLAASGGLAFGIRFAAYRISVLLGIVTDGVLFYYCIAPRSLYQESMAVYEALPEKETDCPPDAFWNDKVSEMQGVTSGGGLAEARRRLSMIVGRDTEALSREGIIKAAVETVAENTSDGVTAPMLYMALGGPALCFCYKAVNTMDSMLGYHNDTYEYFGKMAARMDDVWNYVPSRLTAYAMLLGALLTSMDVKGGLRIYKRDRRNHKSPNSAQTESVCAGVLGVQLAGDASYFGKIVQKPSIGDAVRAVEREDIRRANHLMYAAAVIVLLAAMELRILWYFW